MKQLFTYPLQGILSAVFISLIGIGLWSYVGNKELLFTRQATGNTGIAHQQKPARLIIRGDDMGYTHSGNLAIMKAYKEGIEKSIEVIVPSPWFPEAVKMLGQIPDADVGIHLALTSEWDHVKWRPLTDCPSLRDEDGYFYPMIQKNKNYPGRALTENQWKIEDVEKEFRAQIELALKKIPRISHVSAHMGCSNISPQVKELTRKLAREYKIDIDPASLGVTSISYAGPQLTRAEKESSFINMLGQLKAGETYLFVEHPGFDDAELRAVHHIGYENVADDRQGVTDMWTSEKVKAEIKKRNIQIISYKDLLK
ncbi:ChbG/HpnK family deacetylase [Rhodocytophaga rosea]|uniref:ChbG/HpnK family deacetylase n=1 Tax=Rhodocytophaga rosea TaxID=2704465 RepID=A0A6C0GC92_9BACT|nr:polysaccharide deacetylase family protein [Rhodocytophaga rosea]QHT65443.1 ChbG/HpnK family deacetylase [Rhodocytophaga rosea]